MTTHYRTKGFVFKKSDLSESDRNFSVFTENFGRLDIFAKAIRKSVSKLRSGIDIFYISDIEFIQGKNKKTLTDTLAIERFKNLTHSTEKFKIASMIGEILDNFIRGQEPDRNIFNLINETLAELNKIQDTRYKIQALYYYFLWNFLSFQGYKPEVDKCNACQDELNPYHIYFSNRLGGVICNKCFNHDSLSRKINSDIVKILRLVLKRDWGILSRLRMGEDSQKLFKKTSDNYYFYISDIINKTL